MAKQFLKIMHGRRFDGEKWKNQEKEFFKKNFFKKRVNDFFELFFKNKTFFFKRPTKKIDKRKSRKVITKILAKNRTKHWINKEK